MRASRHQSGKGPKARQIALAVVSALLIAALGVYWLFSAFSEARRPDSMRSQTVTEAFGPLDDEADVLLVKDADRGWFLIARPSRVANVSFELADHGTLGGISPMEPIACGTNAARSRAVLHARPGAKPDRNGVIPLTGPVRCAARRMEVRALADHGESIQLRDDWITMEARDTVDATLAADPSGFWIMAPDFRITFPEAMSPSHTCRIEGPYIWPAKAASDATALESMQEIEARLKADIAALLRPGSHGLPEIDANPITPPQFDPAIPASDGILQIVYAGEGDYRGLSSIAIRKVSAAIPVTDPEDCVRLSAVDLTQVYRLLRDPARLDAHFAEATAVTGAPRLETAPRPPGRSELLAPGTGLLPPEAITRRAIWAAAPSDD